MMRRRSTVLVLGALALAVPSTAWAMNVVTFLAKAEALQKKGPLAMFSRDLRFLMNEGKAASAALRAERLADIKAGRNPDYCPPERSSMGSNEVLAHMRSIPKEQRGMSFKSALAGLLKKKFPCPA